MLFFVPRQWEKVSFSRLKTGLYSPRNDPDAEMIPNSEMIPKSTPKKSLLFFLSTPKWSPRNYGMVIKHGIVDYVIIKESKSHFSECSKLIYGADISN